jgi:hypothetical protein
MTRMMTKVLYVNGEMSCLRGTETLNILNTVIELQCKYTCLAHTGVQIVVESQQNSSPKRLIALQNGNYHITKII